MSCCSTVSKQLNSPARATELSQTKLAPWTQDEAQFTALFQTLRELGWRGTAQKLGMKEVDLRTQLATHINSVCTTESGWALAWSEEKALLVAGYDTPEVISYLSDLIQMYAMEVGVYLELTPHVLAAKRRKIRDLTNSYLKLGEAAVTRAIHATKDAHQLVHIEEVATTFAMTMLQLVDTIQDYPTKPEFETRPTEQVFELHSQLGGLLESAYLFDDGNVVAGSVGTQRLRRRLTLDTDRRGRDVSFEELANVYRTSRVTISNILHRILSKMQRQLRLSKLDAGALFTT